MRLHVVTSAIASLACCVGATAQPILLATDPGGGSIIRINPADAATESILLAKIQYPHQITVDAQGGKMYWTTAGLWSGDTIQRANLDGSDIETLIETTVRAIALDPSEGWLYWATYNSIERISVDGTQREVILDSVQTRTLALDARLRKLYWTEDPTESGGMHTIKRSNLDGSGIETVETMSSGPSELLVDQSTGKLYWMRSTGQQCPAICIGRASPHGVEVLVNHDLGWGPFSAIDERNQRLFIGLYNYSDPAQNAIIHRYGLIDESVDTIELPVDSYRTSLSIVGDHLYWTDELLSGIYRSRLDGTGTEPLIETPIADPQHIDVDLAVGKMYWAERWWIRRANLDGSDVENIVLANYGNWATAIRDLSLDLKNRKLYWTLWDGWTDHDGGVFRSNLDGSDIDSLWYGGAFGVQSDPEAGHLYFTDAYRDEDYFVRIANLDGTFARMWHPEPVYDFALDASNRVLYLGLSNEIRYVSANSSDPGWSTSPYRINLSGLSSLALDVEAEKLYWVRNRGPDDGRYTTITRANLDGFDQDEVFRREGSPITDLSVIPEPMPTASHQDHPTGFGLFPAYPNPFNPATTIRFSLAAHGHVRIEVRDVLGKVVGILFDENASAGAHRVVWEPDPSIPSGAYFYTLESGTITITRSVVLLR
jgi:hypothetical protein